MQYIISFKKPHDSQTCEVYLCWFTDHNNVTGDLIIIELCSLDKTIHNEVLYREIYAVNCFQSELTLYLFVAQILGEKSLEDLAIYVCFTAFLCMSQLSGLHCLGYTNRFIQYGRRSKGISPWEPIGSNGLSWSDLSQVLDGIGGYRLASLTLMEKENWFLSLIFVFAAIFGKRCY